ncbi:tRNA (N(6)-L-threonylcarbamoyladenosine(37)-C(2))-methylthiotransferase [Ignisphaera sp. 4213-co]|uniref:tRNA-t(6)A37 methylthiotransferase n=1 Tax=Ignisphaera cupida TaxID=3050454 RepID=A0ABD4Z5W0_9CREN|nr:tRNA (N(6)-L-threonylcarbamoyladenosine(37)-C(2))-methylthiotransferase [Ignisphaera sp. 4213-co]MDK6028352.1 tRNA (N(6)-L-threonylcarbamoyladenosine(37)-C(2))-methylthiotransferase [Ignisphaera sp. 4213-co]
MGLKGKRIYIETYGCTLNKADSAIMKTILVESGYEVVDNIEDADVIVLNTCVVRYDTESRMFSRIEELKKLNKKVIVAGCLARVFPAKVRKIFPQASLIVPQSINRIVEAVESSEPVMLFDEFKEFSVLPRVVEGVTASIPVAEGCLDECSFCIVKVARPHLKSVPIEKVVNVFKDVISRGAIEVEITAQDLSVYGYDLYGKYALPELLNSILSVEGDYMIRLGQMNPRHLINYLDEIIEILKDPRVYKHLHIPVQSGDNKVLKLMNRGYTVEDFISIVNEVRKKIEGVHIATDIIVGHPGEDETAFMESIKLITEYSIDRVHIARYSPRPFTKSSLMPQLPDPVKKSRSSYIESVYEKVALEINREYVGSRAKVVITEVDRVRNKAIGRLFNYRPVVLDVGGEYLGKKAVVEINDATFFDLRGRLLHIL